MISEGKASKQDELMITLIGEPDSQDSDSEIVISCVRSISSDTNKLECNLSERDSDEQEEVSEETSQEKSSKV